ncbi:MFS transporter [Pseudomonas sp. 5P_3.1_Bac2]|uniref:MFS transporter n=1 Tax=Pseudomonas sp. 5P_3.1_Bac2 TaxID=2971617 RepID=UPI0021C75DDE|nr:MFS transporter [Pseudomonas sp. 5P_3.1_Bac2]MCU1717680.1 MFS transporter [Pseudomonas sp. 5P_3.1_Bac2]
MAGIYAVLFLLGLETTLGGSVLPQAAAQLEGLEHIGWLSTIQMLAAACATPVTARLGDIWRRKWLVFISIILLCTAGCLAAAASSMGVLLASRVVNGVALGMMAGSAFAVPVDVFPDPAQRIRWQSISGVMFAISSSLGPVLGAVLSEFFGWRMALLVLPGACLPVLLALATMPDLQARSLTRQRFDVYGALLMSLFIVGSLLGLQSLGHSHAAWLYWLVGALALLLLWRQQQGVQQPILALEVLHNTQVRVISLTTVLSGAILAVLMFYSPLLLTTLNDMSFREAGLVMMPMLIGMPLGSLLNSFLFPKLAQPKRLFCLGSALLIGGTLWLVMLPQGLSSGAIMVGYGLSGVGLGFINQNQTLFVQMVTPRQFVGAATGLVSTARSYGSALGSAVVGLAILSMGLQDGLVIALLLTVVCALLVFPISLRIQLNDPA